MKKLILIGIIIILSSLIYADDIAFDDFECGDINCGEGWNNVWEYSGDFRITSENEPFERYHLQCGSECKVNRIFSNVDYDSSEVVFLAKTRGLREGETCEYLYMVNGIVYSLLKLDYRSEKYDKYTFDLTEYGHDSDVAFYVNQNRGRGYCYLDNINIYGEQEEIRLDIFLKSYYMLNETDVPIEMISSVSNTVHTLELRNASGDLFCANRIVSPFVPYTTFLTYCDMPSIEQINASAKLFVTDKPETFVIKYFNVTDPHQNENMLMIKKVYFSPQVLQGSSTEIFAVVEKSENITINKIQLTLTFPDGTKRILYMEETTNEGEFRAFITDTYQVGDVYFSIRVESKDYYDTYNNYYIVAAYNVDFVSLVNEVHSILTQPPGVDVLGTYYEAGDDGKVIAQLSDQGIPVNNATCYVSIYYPDNSNLARHEYMTHLIDSDGLYIYDLIIPKFIGVYPVSVTCDYTTNDTQYNTLYIEYHHGVHLSRWLNDLWYEDGDYSVMTAEINYTLNTTLLNLDLYWYNVSSITAESDFIVQWVGYTEIFDGEADVLWWDWNSSEWDLANNTLDSELTHQTFFSPNGNNIYRNINGTIKIKINGSAPIRYVPERFFYDNFEDNNISDWDLRCYPTATCNVSHALMVDNNSELNQTYSMFFKGNLTTYYAFGMYYVNATGYKDINLSYTRKCVGRETNDYFYFMSSVNGGFYQYHEWFRGNAVEERKTFQLSASYDNCSNITIRIIQYAREADDHCYVDDVAFTGLKIAAPIIHTDMVTVRGIDISGVVNEVRGGGELNVKNLLTIANVGIEKILDTLQGYETTLTYSAPSIVQKYEKAVITVRLTYSKISRTYMEMGAECSGTIWGPSNETGVGEAFITDFEMIELGSGTYFYNFTAPSDIGIYTVETNCIKVSAHRNYYGLTNFMVQDIETEVWNASNRNLTYYEPVNTTLIAEDVWNYSGNITTSNVVTTIISEVWSYVSRYTHGIIT